MPTRFLHKTVQFAKNVLITLGIILFLPVSCVGVFSIEDFVRDTRAQSFCDSIRTGMSRSEVLAIAKEAPHMKYYPDQRSEPEMRFTIWGFMGVAGTVCAVTMQDDFVACTRVFPTLS